MDDELSNEEYASMELDTRIGYIVREALSEITGAVTEYLRKQMLDDDAREKFLGKPEEIKQYEKPYYAMDWDKGLAWVPRAFVEAGSRDDVWPEHHYHITDAQNRYLASFERKDTRDLVLRFLNGETDA